MVMAMARGMLRLATAMEAMDTATARGRLSLAMAMVDMATEAMAMATARGRPRLATAMAVMAMEAMVATDTATARGLLRPSPATDTAMDMVTAMATMVENAPLPNAMHSV